MKKRLAILLVAASAFGASASVAVAAPKGVAAPVWAAKTCSGSYTLAHLSWGDKCLRAGEFCKVGNREYRRYHFVCPATGHLRRLQ